MTFDPAEMIWDVDIENAVLDMHNRAVDEEYYLLTVETIENGIDPHTRQRLTRTCLDAWMARCLTQPTDLQETSHEPQDRRTITPSSHRLRKDP